MSGDPRLAEQAIAIIAESNADDGLVWGAAPSRGANVIATFSLAWVACCRIGRWSSRPAPIVRHLPRMRTVLGWFEPWLNSRKVC